MAFFLTSVKHGLKPLRIILNYTVNMSLQKRWKIRKRQEETVGEKGLRKHNLILLRDRESKVTNSFGESLIMCKKEKKMQQNKELRYEILSDGQKNRICT